MSLEHCEGWENADRICDIMASAYEVCKCSCDKSRKTLQKVVEAVVKHFEPEFYDDIHEERSCKRKLRYIYKDDETDNFFIYGKIYESLTFNGTCYTIKDWNGYIGCAHFDRLT